MSNKLVNRVIPGVISYCCSQLFGEEEQSNTDVHAMSHSPPDDSVTQCSLFYPTTQARRVHMLVTLRARASFFRSSFGMPHNGTAVTACSSQHVKQGASAHATNFLKLYEVLHQLLYIQLTTVGKCSS